MNNINTIRDILVRATGEQIYNVEALSRMAHDIIKGDRILIKILGRNIESLTIQMSVLIKENQTLKERLKKYE